MKCLMCESICYKNSIFKIKDRMNIDERIFSVHACVSCSSLVIDPIPSDAEIEKLYPKDYNFKLMPLEKGIKGLLKKIEWNLFYKRVYKKSYDLIKQNLKKQNFKVLDVGCGSGLRLKVFRDMGCDVCGNDISDACIDYMTNTLGIHTYKGKLEDLDLREESFDAVLMFALFEHLKNPSPTISSAKKLLKKDGLLVIRVPVVDSIQFRLFKKRAYAVSGEMPRHIFIPSIRGLIKFMEKQSFQLITYKPISLLEIAAFVSLSLYPGSSALDAYGKSKVMCLTGRVFGWILSIFPGIIIGLYETLRGIGVENIFFFKKMERQCGFF